MAANYLFAVEGLSSLSDIENLSEEVLKKARQAINRTADHTRTQASRLMRQQVQFPARYLDSRLTVGKRASGKSLAATITGRDRPTSLARFAKSKDVAASRKAGAVKVQVGHSTKTMRGAFLMTLRNNNLGLAMRLKPGESIRNKKLNAAAIGKGLYLLYGPSVDQVFRTNIDQLSPGAADYLEREFIRLMGLK